MEIKIEYNILVTAIRKEYSTRFICVIYLFTKYKAMLIGLRNSFWYIRVTLTFSNSNMKTRKGSVHSDIRSFQCILTIVIFCHRQKTCDVSVTLTLPCIAGAFRLAPKDCYHSKYIIDLPIGIEMVYVHIIVTLPIVLLQKNVVVVSHCRVYYCRDGKEIKCELHQYYVDFF